MLQGMPYLWSDLDDVANSMAQLRVKEASHDEQGQQSLLTACGESRRVRGLLFPFGDVLRFLETLHDRPIIR